MERLGNSRRSPPFVLLFAIFCGTAHAAAQGVPSATPIPDVTGPIPVAADSYPLMAASKIQDVVDLPKLGYVEEEFFVSGRANVYDWAADGTLSVRTPAAPYATRILVRRPVDPRRFSGNVIVELPNMARRYDWSMTWGLSHDYFIEHGDVWVGLTHGPVGIDGLKSFNATRYAPLAMANPTPNQTCPAVDGGRGGAAPGPPGTEEGLRWDIISQVGALLKTPRASGLLAGFNVQRVYGTSHVGELPTYIAAVHPHANLANGRPVYDGYVVYRNVTLVRMHQCATAPAATDPRQILRNVNVPVIRIIPGETDALNTYARRREDSDAPGDRYRHYELAGAPHADRDMYRYIPSREDQMKVGTPPYLNFWPFLNVCDIEGDLLEIPIQTYAGDAAFANLDRWVRDGVAPPRAARISVENGGTPQARVVTDQFGNAVGGVRSPYLDVPVATYHVSRPGGQLAPGVRCEEIGYKVPFDWARLEKLYGTSQKYAAKVAESVDRLVRERWLTESDGRKIKAESAVPSTSSR
jgi:hypothetical protein